MKLYPLSVYSENAWVERYFATRPRGLGFHSSPEFPTGGKLRFAVACNRSHRNPSSLKKKKKVKLDEKSSSWSWLGTISSRFTCGRRKNKEKQASKQAKTKPNILLIVNTSLCVLFPFPSDRITLVAFITFLFLRTSFTPSLVRHDNRRCIQEWGGGTPQKLPPPNQSL